jgi:hypothetical protein
MQSDCPVGHVHVPVRQVCPPLQSCVVQQLEAGMHAAWHVFVPVGHWHVLPALQSSPSPQLALAQQGRFRVPHVPVEPSLPASGVEASPLASLAVASEPVEPLSTASWSPCVASATAPASPQLGAQLSSWMPSSPAIDAHPPPSIRDHATSAIADGLSTRIS